MFLREGMVDEAFEFLLHDAHEIYVGDMSTGLKTICPDFKCIEHRVESIVREKFGLPPVITPIVKVMDLRMLATEKNQILHNSKDEYWPMLDGYPPLNFEIEEQSYQHVRKRFIGMFEELRGSYKGAPYGKLTFGNTT